MAMLFPFFPASAYDFELDGIYYNIDAENGTASVSKGEKTYKGEIFIPDEINIKGRTLKVVSLNCGFTASQITTISIGQYVSEIAFNDFEECNALKEIVFRDADEPIELISISYYSGGSHEVGLFYKLPLEKVYFGRTIILTKIEEGSSYTSTESPFVYSNYSGIKGSCNALEDVVFAGKCRIIPAGICENLSITSITVGESVNTIGADAFSKCSSLTRIIIDNINKFSSINFENTPQNGRFIYDNNGEVITSLHIDSQNISPYAFYSVQGIETISLSDSVKTVGDYAFSNIPSLNNVRIDGDINLGDGVFANNVNLNNVEIEQLSDIGDRMFYSSTSLSRISLPKTKSIGIAAFSKCINLEIIDVPQLTSIANEAFSCTKVNEIYLPLVTTLGDSVFNGCTELVSADLGVKVHSIGKLPFKNCNNLKSLTIKSLEPPIANGTFSNYTYVNTILKVPENSLDRYKASSPWSYFFEIAEVKLNYFQYENCIYYIDGESGILISIIDKDIEKLNIPGTINFNEKECVISDFLDNCFNDLTSVKEISFPSSFQKLPNIRSLRTLENVSVESNFLPESYFKDLVNLSYVDLGSQMIEIGNNSFEGCEKLQKICIPPSCIKIGNEAFLNCVSIESIDIPGSCNQIGNGAFNGMKNLRNVIIEDSNIPLSVGHNNKRSLSNTIVRFPNPSTLEERRTEFRNGYYDGLFYGLPIERLIINRNIELPRYYERTRGLSTSSYRIMYYDIIYYPPFYGLSKLKYVEIGENVSAICKNKIEAVVNAEPTTMEYKNFGQCNNIEIVVSNNHNAPIGGGFSQNAYENAILFLPNGSEESYKTDEYWKNFAHLSATSFVPIETISFDAEEFEIGFNESQQLKLIINPEDASIHSFKWSSSAPWVVRVSNDGIITSFETEGESIITATSTDGSDKSVSCKIIVRKSNAGIEDIYSSEEQRTYVVYNLQGIMVLRTEKIQDFQDLPAGIYIVNGKKTIIN